MQWSFIPNIFFFLSSEKVGNQIYKVRTKLIISYKLQHCKLWIKWEQEIEKQIRYGPLNFQVVKSFFVGKKLLIGHVILNAQLLLLLKADIVIYYEYFLFLFHHIESFWIQHWHLMFKDLTLYMQLVIFSLKPTWIKVLILCNMREYIKLKYFKLKTW